MLQNENKYFQFYNTSLLENILRLLVKKKYVKPD